MIDTIKTFSTNSVFQFITGICSIVGGIVGILAIIPFTREKFFSFKQKIKIDEQSINGSSNIQTGGNIYREGCNGTGSDLSTKQTTKINIGKQQISGSNNIQTGGDLNG